GRCGRRRRRGTGQCRNKRERRRGEQPAESLTHRQAPNSARAARCVNSERGAGDKDVTAARTATGSSRASYQTIHPAAGIGPVLLLRRRGRLFRRRGLFRRLRGGLAQFLKLDLLPLLLQLLAKKLVRLLPARDEKRGTAAHDPQVALEG